jgi:hypothetical protein
VRLVIIGTVVVIVPFFTLLLFKALTLLMPVFNPVACISVVDDVAKILTIPVSSSIAFLRWTETACRVPVTTLPVVTLMTSCFVITVESQVNHGCCIQHHLEVLHVCINFFVVLWQVGCQLIDEHPSDQGVMCQSAVDLLPLVLDLINFLMD